MKTRLPIGPALLLSVAMLGELQFVPPARSQNPDRARSQPAPSNDSDLQMFGGRITKSNGAFVLR
ncbi:MAG: hypothetical protein WAK20_09485, partial [Candidatus Acidiferrum sp.]